MKINKITFLGTASSVGKSTIATAFCRYFKKKGYNVAPFKALNISLNSFVTKDGYEIARSQVVQAEACEIEPKEYMNPVLMKPSIDNKTQIIVRGKVYCNIDSKNYKDLNIYLKKVVKEAFKDITNDYDTIVLEGSGSCCEINLRKTDISNINMAKDVSSPIILISDIDKGGVFASVFGTIMLLPEEERKLIKGVIINKFSGDKKSFEPAVKQLENLINIPILGVMPYFNLDIEEEDGETEKLNNIKKCGVDIAVVHLPHMSNFTDFNAFKTFDNFNVRYVKKALDLLGADIIIIPGTKNTMSDLLFLKENGFKEIIDFENRKNTIIFGICGGYQILGKGILDPEKVESEYTSEEGFGYLDIKTVFNKEKMTTQVEAFDQVGNTFIGYEIHNGYSFVTNKNNIWLKTKSNKIIGMKNEKGNVFGTYLHGIFDNINIKNLLTNLNIKTNTNISYKEYKTKQYDALCKLLEENIDVKAVEKIMIKE